MLRFHLGLGLDWGFGVLPSLGIDHLCPTNHRLFQDANPEEGWKVPERWEVSSLECEAFKVSRSQVFKVPMFSRAEVVKGSS